jgi:hypothetical protein
MWTLEDEQALREDLIEKIISKAKESNGMPFRAELDSFSSVGQARHFIEAQRDFWNPGAWSRRVHLTHLQSTLIRFPKRPESMCEKLDNFED